MVLWQNSISNSHKSVPSSGHFSLIELMGGTNLAHRQNAILPDARAKSNLDFNRHQGMGTALQHRQTSRSQCLTPRNGASRPLPSHHLVHSNITITSRANPSYHTECSSSIVLCVIKRRYQSSPELAAGSPDLARIFFFPLHRLEVGNTALAVTLRLTSSRGDFR